MLATLSSDSRPIIGRGPPLGAGFFFLALVSLAMMIADHRGPHLERVRQWLGMGLQPAYVAVHAPQRAWEWVTGSFADRARLRTENARLQEQLRTANVKLLQFDSLRAENSRLRAIRAASAGFAQRTLIAEIVRVDLDPFRHRVLINKGTRDGVFKGQSVVDAFGIFGQVTRVRPFTSEVILISDSEHALPVQVNRNGVRSIAVGAGDMAKLSLPFMTVDTDVRPEDLLVSSGLGGIFPSGYPVARVTRVKRDPAATFAVVEARPLAHLDRTREVLLLWFDPEQRVEPPATASASEATPSTPAPPTSAQQSPAAASAQSAAAPPAAESRQTPAARIPEAAAIARPAESENPATAAPSP